MTFYINYTNGSNLTAINDGTISTNATSLTLIGKNYPLYGQLLNQNLVSLLENFSNSSAPNNPLVGQLWYDSTNNTLKYYRDGASNNYWQNLPNIVFSATTPSSPQLYDLWWDTTNKQLNIYDSLNWINIGPQSTNNGLNRVIGTNSFIVQIGGTNVFSIDYNGRVNAPYNPTIQALGTANVTGNGIGFPRVFSPTSYLVNNVGSALSNGVLTCPVSGIYQVRGSITTLGYSTTPTTTVDYRLTVQKNSSDSGLISYISQPNQISGSSNYLKNNLIVDGFVQCNSGDTLNVAWYGTSGAQVDNTSANMSIRLVG